MRVGVCAVAWLGVVLAGCRPPAVEPAPPEATGAPAATELVAAHAAEVERLATLVSSGIVEVRWRDEDGAHFEQGELDLRYRAPEELSFRVGKLGETHLLAGCNASRWWWYDGWSKPTRLVIGSRAAREEAGDVVDGGAAAAPASSFSPPIQPDELLVVLGMRRLPDPTPDRAAAPGPDGTWVVELAADESPLGLPVRATFGRAGAVGAVGWSLVGLDVLDAEGREVLAARYGDHRRVERRGVPPGEWPVVATRLHVTIPPRGDRGGFDWLIELDRPSATGERIVERLFDPEAIRASLRADVVEVEGKGGDGS